MIVNLVYIWIFGFILPTLSVKTLFKLHYFTDIVLLIHGLSEHWVLLEHSLDLLELSGLPTIIEALDSLLELINLIRIHIKMRSVGHFLQCLSLLAVAPAFTVFRTLIQLFMNVSAGWTVPLDLLPIKYLVFGGFDLIFFGLKLLLLVGN